MKISVNAPSYKRANEVLTLAYLPFCKVWVDEGEEDEYREHYPDAEIISCPKGIQGNVARVRNYILRQEMAAGYDVVYASYDTKRQAGWRNLGSWANSKMTEIMLGKPPELVVNSYFAARRFVVEEMLRYEHCYPYVIGLVLRSTKHICNVPVHHRAREEGSSGYTLRKLLNLWMNGFTSFSVKPLRIATYFGTLFAAAGFVYLIYIVIDHFTRGAAPMGWASTTALLLLLGGMILVVLGIIGEYVGRIYMCANAAPQYVEREVIRHEEDNA
jgi:hypothetical protein